MKYFKKESLRNQVFVGKTPIIFQPVGHDTGIAVLDETKDAATIKVLEILADQRAGGIVRISAEIVEGLKKNEALTPSPRRSFLNQIRISPSPDQFGQKQQAAPSVAAASPPQIRIMEEDQIPPSSIQSFRARTKPANPVNR